MFWSKRHWTEAEFDIEGQAVVAIYRDTDGTVAFTLKLADGTLAEWYLANVSVEQYHNFVNRLTTKINKEIN
jgi:hypothetical protein